ncbi:MAG: M20/M25/M40 family metallo-hydrolase [Nitrososphaerales archaeon]
MNYEVGFLTEMLRIYSPSRMERELALFLKDSMSKELGFKNVFVDEVNNVVGEVGSGSPKLLLCGHMDTVPGYQPTRISKGFIYGRGACDAKSALASMILAASKVADKQDVGKIIVAAVSDEEGNSLGLKELLRRGIDADYAIFGEPSGLDNITVGYKGRLALKLICETPSVHASAPWMSENAVERLLEVWQAIKASFAEKGVDGDRYRSITSCLTKIRGGSSHNVMPGRCSITVDIRIPPNYTTTQILNNVKAIVGKFERDLSFPKFEMQILDQTEPFEADRNSPILRALVRAILKIRGKRPLLINKTGTGDMNTLGTTLRIPVVTYGPGNPHLSHTRKEGIEIKEFLQSIEIFQAVILELANLTRSK